MKHQQSPAGEVPLRTILRVVRPQIPVEIYRRCQQAANAERLAAETQQHQLLRARVREQPWAGRVVAEQAAHGRAWAGVRTPQAFVWQEAGAAAELPSNDELLAREIDRALQAGIVSKKRTAK